MSKKNKTHYLNLDKNQLADKGKTKLQYEENCKEAAKRYSESKKHEKDIKTSKGTVSNIGKKILAATITLSISATTLTGCSAYGFTYESNNEGVRYATGTVANKYIENCYYIEINDPNYENVEKYMTVKETAYGETKYYDVFTLETIYVEDDEAYSNIDIVRVVSVEDYLEEKNNKKTKYTVDDMEEIFEQMSSENSEKKLIKGK